MHNCKATRERIAELVASGVESPQVELFGCADCRNEFETLKATLRIGLRAIESISPPEAYWNSYHTKLRNRLLENSHPVLAVTRRSWLSRLFTSSVRIPVPLAMVAVLLIGVSFVFAFRQRTVRVEPANVSMIRVPVEVPVIQEKVTTRVVYRQRKARSASAVGASKVFNPIVAKSEPAPLSLKGFKPLDEVKLTVIKGGSPDEK